MQQDKKTLEQILALFETFDKVVNVLYAPIHNHEFLDRDSFDYTLGLAERNLPDEERVIPQLKQAYSNLKAAIEELKRCNIEELKRSILKAIAPTTKEGEKFKESDPAADRQEGLLRLYAAIIRKAGQLDKPKLYDENSLVFRLASEINELDIMVAKGTEGGAPVLTAYLKCILKPTGLGSSDYTDNIKYIISKIEPVVARTYPLLNMLFLESQINGNKNTEAFGNAARHLLYFMDYRKESPLYMLVEKKAR